MDLPLNMVIFQPTMLVFKGCKSYPKSNWKHFIGISFVGSPSVRIARQKFNMEHVDLGDFTYFIMFTPNLWKMKPCWLYNLFNWVAQPPALVA